MRKPISINFKGKKFRAVGSRLYVGLPTQTFHEFCIQIAATDFGGGWYQKERFEPEEKRHIVANWYISYCDFTKKRSAKSRKMNGVWSVLPSGDVWSLITLGYDLYSLRHNAEVPEELIIRLKDRDSFQGGRYELAVAAIFARLDFDIVYMHDKSTKHWEFNAKHKTTGEIIAVEAKSRHRSGVLHQPGNRLPLDEIKVGIARMLNQALEQKPNDLPFIVFIDLNLPLSPDAPHPERKWWKDLEKAIAIQGIPSPDAPQNFNVLFVTNFSYHYGRKDIINTGKYSSDSCVVIPKYSKIPFKDKRTLSMIHQEVSSYGHVPHDW